MAFYEIINQQGQTLRVLEGTECKQDNDGMRVLTFDASNNTNHLVAYVPNSCIVVKHETRPVVVTQDIPM